MPDNKKNAKEFRLILHPGSMADPVFSYGQHGELRLNSLYLKRFNDELPLRLLPDSLVSRRSISEASCVKAGKLRFGPKEEIDSMLSVIRIGERKMVSSEIRIPILTTPLAATHLNWIFELKSNLPVDLALINNANPIVAYASDRKSRINHIDLSDSSQKRLDIQPETSIGVWVAGQAYYYLVKLECVSLTPSSSSLHFSFHNGTLAIHRRLDDAQSGQFCLFVSPVLGRRLIGGAPTFSFLQSEMIIAVDLLTVSPRVLGWLGCTISSVQDIPLAFPPKYIPQRTLPNLVVFDLKKRGWLMPKGVQSLIRLKEAKKVIMFGDIPSDFFKEMVDCGKYRLIGLISESVDTIREGCRQISVNADPSQPHKLIWSRKKTTDVFLLYCPSFLGALRVLEDLFIELLNHPPREVSEKLKQISDYHIRHRLEPVPFCPDLTVGMVSLVCNMIRGRMPLDTGSTDVDYRIYRKSGLWMVPWPKGSFNRESLITELNIRIASEFLASRAFVELFGETWRVESGHVKDPEKIRAEFHRAFDIWEHWGQATSSQKSEIQKRIRSLMCKESVPTEYAVKCLAEAAYEACSGTGSFKGRDPRTEMLGRVNPLVIVYASGGDDPCDATLNFDYPFWALYAGRSTSNKAGAIVPSLLHHSEVSSIKSLQFQLRQALHKSKLTKGDLHRIHGIRKKLVKAIGSTILPSTYEVLKKLNPDRIVAFSDVLVDHTPYEGTIIGLEYPVSRYPTSIPALFTVNRAVASAQQLWPFERIHAAILCTRESRDATTTWARQIAKDIGGTLELLGCSVTYPVESCKDTESLISTLEGMHIVLFIGHATASAHWAELDLGHIKLPISDIGKKNWDGTFVVLVGCETAAIDAAEGDIATELIRKGARAVVGTLAKIRVDVAKVFLEQFFVDIFRGLPADYAFFSSRRKALIYEILRRSYTETDAISEARRLLKPRKDMTIPKMSEILNSINATWEKVASQAPYALSLTLLGGTGERLV